MLLVNNDLQKHALAVLLTLCFMDISLSKNTPRSRTTSEQSTTESQTWSDRELGGIFSRLVHEPNQINSVFDGLSCNRNEA